MAGGELGAALTLSSSVTALSHGLTVQLSQSSAALRPKRINFPLALPLS